MIDFEHFNTRKPWRFELGINEMRTIRLSECILSQMGLNSILIRTIFKSSNHEGAFIFLISK